MWRYFVVRVEFWVMGFSFVGVQLIVKVMKVDVIIREICLGRVGKQSKGKRIEQGLGIILCFVFYYIFFLL